MSKEKKYITFRDLRTATPKPKSAEKTDTSISSSPSITSAASIPSTGEKLVQSSSYPKGGKVNQPKVSKGDSVAPERDFQRIPNSVTREALPEGIFRGKSKQVWDYLWSVSRGAITPVRVVRKSRREIKTGAGLGSMVTVDAALEHLGRVGLISIRPVVGSLIGNEYEVFMPGEVAARYTSTPSISSYTSLTQKVDILDVLDSSISSTTQVVENKGGYSSPKTFFKTDDDDTHTVAEFTKVLVEAARGVVGGDLLNTEQERERWKELANLLADELRDAAKRTESITSVPAFFATHLRRRLSRKAEYTTEAKKTQEPPVPKIYQTFASGRATERKQALADDLSDTRTAGSPTKGSSKFSLDECRRYADHLHSTGQGITNPGGFAMTIYRSGIADAMVEKFLHPVDDKILRETSSCPDCQGTGFYYPKGAAKGVVKCAHARLTAASDSVTAEGSTRRRFTASEINEQARIIAELIESGYTLEKAEAEFASSMHPADWREVASRIKGL
jgi:hypothetical protein